MDKITIGIKKEYASVLATLLDSMDYNRAVRENHEYFTFEVLDWEDSENELASKLDSYLALVVGEDNYGFIIVNEEHDGIEVSGNLIHMNMGIKSQAVFYE